VLASQACCSPTITPRRIETEGAKFVLPEERAFGAGGIEPLCGRGLLETIAIRFSSLHQNL
jgi:hypothetical protein